jgi:hypothetical protein
VLAVTVSRMLPGYRSILARDLSLADKVRCDLDLAEIARVDLEKIERFLRICILLLGKNKLLRMLAELKIEVIEGRGPHNPTGTLIWRLLNEIEQPVRANRATPSAA